MKSAKIKELLVKAYPKLAAGGFPPSPLAQRFIEQAQAYFQGRRVAFDLPMDLAGASDFDRKIYRTLLKVTYGQVRSYGWLAEKPYLFCLKWAMRHRWMIILATLFVFATILPLPVGRRIARTGWSAGTGPHRPRS